MSIDDRTNVMQVANVSADNLETALKMYERAKKGGIDRAAQNIRNVGAKILAKAQKANGRDGKV